jgi:hypothetical protein
LKNHSKGEQSREAAETVASVTLANISFQRKEIVMRENKKKPKYLDRESERKEISETDKFREI